MLAGADAGVGPVENTGTFPDVVYELRHRADRKARVNNKCGRRPNGGPHGHKAFLAPAKIREHARVGHDRGAYDSPSVSVGCGARDLVPGEVAARARLCLDDDRLPPDFR